MSVKQVPRDFSVSGHRKTVDQRTTFFCFLFNVLKLHVCTCFAGYMVSCLASSPTMALSLAPPFIIPFMLFGGFFLNKG